MTHSRTHNMHEHDTYTNSLYCKETTNKTRCHAFMANPSGRKNHLAEHIEQIENKRSLEYQQTIPDPTLLNRHTDDERLEKITNEEMFENPNPKSTGFFQGQENLNTGREVVLSIFI